MDDIEPGFATQGWVDAARGLVSRDAFVAEDVYRLELQQVFDRSWIFLAHESEIPAAGDYVVRRLGSAPVIVVRGPDGSVHVLLNSCRHRGTRLCRADSGRTQTFVCPYHGWSYELDGEGGLLRHRREQLPGRHRQRPRLHADLPRARDARGELPHPCARAAAPVRADARPRPGRDAASPAGLRRHGVPKFLVQTQADPGEKSVILRLWQPVSATEMEIMSWVLAEKEASPGYKERVLNHGFHNFGAAGVFEQDDLEIWASATEASNNPIARQFPYSFQTALPYLAKPLANHTWPGRAYDPVNTEVAQLEFMRHWNRRMMAGH